MSIPVINSNVFGKSQASEFVESPCKERWEPVGGVFTVSLSDLLTPGGSDDFQNQNGTNNPPVTYDQYNISDPAAMFPVVAAQITPLGGTAASSCRFFPQGQCEFSGIVSNFPFMRWVFSIKGFCEMKNRLNPDYRSPTVTGPSSNAVFLMLLGNQQIILNDDIGSGKGDAATGVFAIDRTLTVSMPAGSYSYGLSGDGGGPIDVTKRIPGSHPTAQFTRRCQRNTRQINNLPPEVLTAVGWRLPSDLLNIQFLQVGAIGKREAQALEPYDYLLGPFGITLRDNVPPG